MSYIFGIESTTLQDNEVELLKTVDLYGIVLFARNIENFEQTKNLINDIKNKLGSHLKICVDQEGGRVQRVKFTKEYPSAQDFSEKFINKSEDAEDFMMQNVSEMSRELKNIGFDVNFAPVVDLLYNVDTNLISNRSFGKNPEFVASMCEKFIKFSNNDGIDCVLKHIPGHGMANVDSHLNLPIVNASLEHLMKNDLIPFQKLSKICNLAMTAHVIFTALDDKTPFTLSKKAISFVKNLCPNIKFITDAIEMGALLKFYDKTLESPCENVNEYHSVEERIGLARKTLHQITKDSFNAGCDIVMYCMPVKTYFGQK